MKILESLLIIACALGAVIIGGYYVYENDRVRQAAWDAYEQCVLREYHTLPSTWYAEHGEVPPCEITSRN